MGTSDHQAAVENARRGRAGSSPSCRRRAPQPPEDGMPRRPRRSSNQRRGETVGIEAVERDHCDGRHSLDPAYRVPDRRHRRRAWLAVSILGRGSGAARVLAESLHLTRAAMPTLFAAGVSGASGPTAGRAHVRKVWREPSSRFPGLPIGLVVRSQPSTFGSGETRDGNAGGRRGPPAFCFQEVASTGHNPRRPRAAADCR